MFLSKAVNRLAQHSLLFQAFLKPDFSHCLVWMGASKYADHPSSSLANEQPSSGPPFLALNEFTLQPTSPHPRGTHLKRPVWYMPQTLIPCNSKTHDFFCRAFQTSNLGPLEQAGGPIAA